MVPSKDASLEILGLRKQIETLEEKLNEARTKAPEGSEKFAQGIDEIELMYSFTHGEREYSASTYHRSFSISWDEIFYWISPAMIDEISDLKLKTLLNKLVNQLNFFKLKKINEFKKGNIFKIYLNDNDFQTIKVQLRTLGLINKSTKSRSIKDTDTYWSLTPYGDEVMTRLRAKKR